MITQVHMVRARCVSFKSKKNLTIEISDHMSHVTNTEKEFGTKVIL